MMIKHENIIAAIITIAIASAPNAVHQLCPLTPLQATQFMIIPPKSHVYYNSSYSTCIAKVKMINSSVMCSFPV